MIIGLTGGIGSGKTTVANFFKDLGAKIFIADVEAKKLMNENGDLKNEIIQLFGTEAYVNGELNRMYIASIVFDDAAKLKELNALVHPRVRTQFLKFKKDNSTNLIIYEAAILFESGSNELCDYIITVSANLEEKIERVLKRDSTTREEVINRIKNQLDDAVKITNSHFVVLNNEINYTKQQVFSINRILNSRIK